MRPADVQAFEQRTGSKVEVTLVGSDEALWQKINARNGADFDVFAVNTAELQRYIEARLVQPMDPAAIPNTRRQLPRFRDLGTISGLVHDGKTYGIPYTYAEMGLIYDRSGVLLADNYPTYSLEITPDQVRSVRKDAITATGRSDYANQVNNVLGFPFIFRGALDVRASSINEPMKQAAVHALAELACCSGAVPEAVKRAYPGQAFDFGPEYIIPKPFDPRVLLQVPPAVARAAMESGVARRPIDLGSYEKKLQQMVTDIAGL